MGGRQDKLARTIESIIENLEDSVYQLENATADGKKIISNRILALSKVIDNMWDDALLSGPQKERYQSERNKISYKNALSRADSNEANGIAIEI